MSLSTGKEWEAGKFPILSKKLKIYIYNLQMPCDVKNG